jgi:hypothetical protein
MGRSVSPWAEGEPNKPVDWRVFITILLWSTAGAYTRPLFGTT